MKKFFLWLLCVVLFLLFLPLLLLVAFAPLRYAVVARVGGETLVRLKASYLFRLITVRFLFQKGVGKTQIRIAGIRLGTAKHTETPEKDLAPEKAEPGEAAPQDAPKDEPEPPPDEATDEETTKKKPGKSANKLSGILTYPHRKTIISLVFSCIKKTMRVLLPKRFTVTGTVGFEDPATTGLFFGAYESTAALLNLREKIRLAADFTQPGMRLKISAGGSISLARLMRPTLWLLCKKPIRVFIRFLLKKKEEDDNG
ncbi:MAG: hypothetical protein FWB88_06985 [Defluviitaleaceae bacterium]|nr:hypothetical protein [Defluviitaleaceae bacterium]MCL2239377.1 hypothetical protein [Defluviitaleaceae bacterium]